MKIGLCILNRNEEAGLRAVLPAIDRSLVESVFAVDGGSTDGSLGILQEHGIEVLRQVSAGRGEAFRQAFAHARGKLDALILFSSDGNESAADIGKFRSHLEAGADMVIATRMAAGAVNEEDAHWLRPRKWANLAFSHAAYVAWGRGQRKLTDPINGFRALTVTAWDKLAADGPGYTIEYQCSIRAYKLGLKVAEFPTVEGQRIGGESGAKAIPTGLRFVRLFVDEWRKPARP